MFEYFRGGGGGGGYEPLSEKLQNKNRMSKSRPKTKRGNRKGKHMAALRFQTADGGHQTSSDETRALTSLEEQDQRDCG